jgi:hypothetical protein
MQQRLVAVVVDLGSTVEQLNDGSTHKRRAAHTQIVLNAVEQQHKEPRPRQQSGVMRADLVGRTRTHQRRSERGQARRTHAIGPRRSRLLALKAPLHNARHDEPAQLVGDRIVRAYSECNEFLGDRHQRAVVVGRHCTPDRVEQALGTSGSFWLQHIVGWHANTKRQIENQLTKRARTHRRRHRRQQRVRASLLKHVAVATSRHKPHHNWKPWKLLQVFRN